MDFIHRYIPPEQPGSDLTFILLHGTGGDESDLLPLGKFISPAAGLLGVRGKVLESGASRFFRRLSEGVFDEDDLRFRTHELARFIEWATEAYQLNAEGLVAIGYSNGANIAASLLLLEPAIFRAAILFRAMVPLKPDTLPILAGRSVLMESGRIDPIIPAKNSEELASMLADAGAEVALDWQPIGHQLTQEEMISARTWFAELNLSKGES